MSTSHVHGPASDRNTGAGGPVFSVVVYNYNNLRFMPEALESIAHQLFRDFELIIVDDGSSDESLTYLETLPIEHTLIRTHQVGQARACLEAARRSKGRYIYILDAGDKAAANLLWTVAQYLGESPAKVQFKLVPIGEAGQPLAVPYPDLQFRDDEDRRQRSDIRRTGMSLSPPTSGNVFRRDLFDAIGDISYEPDVDGVLPLLAPFMGKVVSIPLGVAASRVPRPPSSVHAKPLSTERIREDRSRFVRRLQHLNELLARHRPAEPAVPPGRSFFYFWDRLALERVAAGTFVGLGAAVRYAWALLREHGLNGFSARKLAWLAVALLAPHGTRTRMLIEKLDPWRRPAADVIPR